MAGFFYICNIIFVMDPILISQILKESFEIAKQAYSIVSMQILVDNIMDSISHVYRDITHAHLDSVKQAMKSAAQSQNYYSFELINAVGHIRDTINVAQKELNATKSVGMWFWKSSRYLVENSRERALIYADIAIFYIIKALIYDLLDENQEVLAAKKEAILNYENSLNTLFTLEYLESINSSYVEKKYITVDEYVYDPLADYRFLEEVVKEDGLQISEEGYKYIAEERKKLLEDFEDLIKMYLRV